HTVAARAGVTGMMKTLAAEWGEYGIRLNCVAPGTIKTDALGRYPISPDRWKELNRSVLNRMGMAEDIAGTIIFLASDLGNFIT
ncbi:SDR family oxidoreductase, partial [Sulfitobacter sp. HI0021]